jgi:translocation protein SEC72
MWPRARRFGNVYAFATVDLLYTIFWFSAWICLASYVAQGKSLGKSTDSDSSSKDSSSSSSSSSSSKNRRADKTIRATSTTTSSSSGSGCDNWHYGSASKCKLSEAVTIIGVIILYVEPSSLRPKHDPN